MELEEELRVVANNLKSLEVFANDLRQPLFWEVDRILMIKGRRGEGKPERKILQGEHQEPDCQAEAGTVCLKICTTPARRFSHLWDRQAEARAEFADKSVAKLQKEVNTEKLF